MNTNGVTNVGRVIVDVEVANFGDIELMHRGMLRADQVRRLIIQGIVDSGAAMLVLPQSVVKKLGLRLSGEITVTYFDGRRAQRSEARGAMVKLLGREDTFSAMVEPKRKTALIGAIVLEALDLLIDCKQTKLIPRDPRGPIYEIE